ncbi:hypothetical protein GGQ85_001111 [Nitrobacter vulgaris]|uniref:hypothetical protein n=1 Tax=Nitrobacter vulgaris TaxID=29421 RepID=UPI00285F39D1|nr:hypothetical protein [Nitrobacter vulgaris]MDR6303421.1 hypothetical protein [Nitrobacter vulgaris]
MAKIRMRDGLGDMRLKFLIEDTDRHGNVRLYVRKRGTPKVRLLQAPGTREFLEEYWSAVKGNAPATEDRPVLTAPVKGTLHWLCTQYFASADFKGLTDRTRYVRRRILDAICKRDGDSRSRNWSRAMYASAATNAPTSPKLRTDW